MKVAEGMREQISGALHNQLVLVLVLVLVLALVLVLVLVLVFILELEFVLDQPQLQSNKANYPTQLDQQIKLQGWL